MEKSSETFEDLKLRLFADAESETIASETQTYLITTPPSAAASPEAARISSFFNLDKFNFLPKRKAEESSEDYMNNEIEHSDVIEIEVPVIGSEFVRFQKDHEEDEREDNVAAVNQENVKGGAELSIFTTQRQSASDISTPRDDVLTFSTVTQTTPGGDDTTTLKNLIATSSEEISSNEANVEISDDAIESVESKLMEQWKAADEVIDDRSLESKLFTLRSRHNPKFPFNVKIVVNNADEKKSCKSKTSCSQVSFSRSRDRDIDLNHYADYSDEDLLFRNTPERSYFERPNEMRARNARRAQDDLAPLRPAPFPPMRGLKKPSFIERLENESSLERSERINKNLDGLVRFISVWAQVDKFISDRARTAIKRIAYVAGDGDYDDYVLGTKKTGGRKRMVADADEPFT